MLSKNSYHEAEKELSYESYVTPIIYLKTRDSKFKQCTQKQRNYEIHNKHLKLDNTRYEKKISKK